MKNRNCYQNNRAAVFACILAAGFICHAACIQAATIYYTWEDAESRAPDDSQSIRMGGKPQADGGPSYPVDQAKFGQGSLQIGKDRTGTTGFPNQDYELDFMSEIKQMTISLWFKPAESLEMSALFLARYAGDPQKTGSFKFFWEKGTFKFSIKTADGSLGVISAPVPEMEPEAWNHVAMTFKDGEVAFYINGEPFGFPETMPVNAIPAADPEGGRTIFHLASGLPEGSYVDDVAFLSGEALGEKDIHRLFTEGLDASGLKR